MRFLCLAFAVVALASNVAGCGYGDDAEDPLADEEIVDSESALMGNLQPGMALETTARLNLRAGASTSTTIYLTMPLGATVTLRSASPRNGFYQVSYGNRAGWAHGGYLVSADGGADVDEDGMGGAPAPGGGTGVVRQVSISGPRVRSHVQAFANNSCAVNGCPHVIGTRAGHSPTADRAIDMMESTGGRRPAAGGAHGTRVASYALSSGERFKVMYVIWQQRINSLDGRGWRGMADRGSITQNHYDHVHVSFDP
jgi:hypothetical protein